MKKLLPIFFIGVMAFSQVYNAFQWAYFTYHQEEIIALFCINQDFPELQCDGKCHLKKQLIQNQLEERESPTTPPGYLPQLELFYAPIAPSIPTAIQEKHRHYWPYNYDANQHFINSVFHPPRLSA